jgi:PPK2 family polyphosphate:nucleotide phosphotransferase
MIPPKLLDKFHVAPGEKVRLQDFPTTYKDFEELKDLRKEQVKERAARILEESLTDLATAQELLWASDRHAVLVVFQAMDAAGKDGTIKHVMSGINPQGCQVVSFKQPSSEDLDHNFLWRISKALPERGRIGIFNRSHYEDVLVVRVHPEYLEGAKLPDGKRGKSFWNGRYEDINAFEHHLHRNGTVILKFFLHVSKKEQKKRFLERLDNPEKHWKFSTSDLAERGFWKDYMKAYEEAIEATSTPWAPWYVVPADEKWATRAVVASILCATIRSLGLEFPKVSDETRKKLSEAKASLMSE